VPYPFLFGLLGPSTRNSNTNYDCLIFSGLVTDFLFTDYVLSQLERHILLDTTSKNSRTVESVSTAAGASTNSTACQASSRQRHFSTTETASAESILLRVNLLLHGYNYSLQNSNRSIYPALKDLLLRPCIEHRPQWLQAPTPQSLHLLPLLMPQYTRQHPRMAIRSRRHQHPMLERTPSSLFLP